MERTASMDPELPSIFVLRQADSVDDIIVATARRQTQGDGDGTLLLADEQRRVRLPDGSRWDSPRGNFHVGLLLEPELKPCTYIELGYVLLQAICSAIAQRVEPGTQLNHDRTGNLYLNQLWSGRFLLAVPKIPEQQQRVYPWLIMSAIVNVAHHPPNPEPARYTSILASGGDAEHAVTRLLELFARHLLSAINGWQNQGVAHLAQRWRGRLLDGQASSDLDVLRHIRLPSQP